MVGSIISVFSTVNLTTMKPVKVLWVMVNDMDSAIARQHGYQSYPTILKHYKVTGYDLEGIGALKLEPYNNDVEVIFKEVDHVNESNN